MERQLSIFEKYLTLWVALCIATGILLGRVAPAVATVVGVLIKVPVMLLLVSICKRTCYLFRECNLDMPQCSKGKDKLARSEA